MEDIRTNQTVVIKKVSPKWLKPVGVLAAVVLVLGLVAWQTPLFSLGWGNEAKAYQTKHESDVHVRFDMEIFDIVVENYWQVVEEKELAELFRLALSKALGTEEVLASADRSGVANMLANAIKRLPEDKRKAAAVDTGIVVLDNLYPQGRSGLLSEKMETEFRDNVNNINRDRDLYTSLGLAQGASVEEVEEAIKGREGDEGAKYAHSVLSDPNTKAIYDQTKMEPSVKSVNLSSNTLYLDLTQITPATFQEIVGKFEKITEESMPNGIIIDLRGNVGGALDFARFFFALFAGPNQYAYDTFHQGELVVERTPAVAKIASLSSVENIAILADNNTQSTAELMAAIFKKFNKAKIVGTQTKGWGTVENTFPIETQFDETEKYSVLLVHSLTLRDDGEAIETRGVDPDIDTSIDGWQNELAATFSSPAFSKDLIQLILEQQ